MQTFLNKNQPVHKPYFQADEWNSKKCQSNTKTMQKEREKKPKSLPQKAEVQKKGEEH